MDIFLIILIIGFIGVLVLIFLLEPKRLNSLSLGEVKTSLKNSKRVLIFLFIVFIVMLSVELWQYIQHNHTSFYGSSMMLLAISFHLLYTILHKRVLKKKKQEEK